MNLDPYVHKEAHGPWHSAEMGAASWLKLLFIVNALYLDLEKILKFDITVHIGHKSTGLPDCSIHSNHLDLVRRHSVIQACQPHHIGPAAEGVLVRSDVLNVHCSSEYFLSRTNGTKLHATHTTNNHDVINSDSLIWQKRPLHSIFMCLL